ncbi:MAG: SRPBCC domain-containing protein [Candidatus Latescibacteria bacterium]|nr:SRPBCC domain-containing protein [Candidatus Latescibacterota bacterium]
MKTLATALLITTIPVVAAASDRVLRADVVVPAPVAEVWKAWTTTEGITSFFAPGGAVDLRVDGTYDVWFALDAPPGLRGADAMRILDVDPEKRFVFTWNAPPTMPTVRAKRTVVVVDFTPVGDDRTNLRFTHLGWGDGTEWDQAYEYFDRAWRVHVLPHLIYRFEKGPIDWKNPPEVEPVAPTIKMALAGSREDAGSEVRGDAE